VICSPRKCLALFLVNVHNNVGDASLHTVVEAAMMQSELYQQFGRPSVRTLPDLSEVNYRKTLDFLSESLERIQVHLRETADHYIEQHGAITEHASVDDLLKKLNNSLDTREAELYHRQIATLGANHLGSALRETVAGDLDLLQQHLDTIVGTVFPDESEEEDDKSDTGGSGEDED